MKEVIIKVDFSDLDQSLQVTLQMILEKLNVIESKLDTNTTPTPPPPVVKPPQPELPDNFIYLEDYPSFDETTQQK